MEKIAIIELDTTKVKLVFANVTKNKSFSIYNHVDVPINLMKDFNEENVIKSTIIKEVVGVLSVFKKMIDKEEITETICVATSKINEAKNQNGFLNEIFSTTNFRFSILEPEQEVNYVYTAVINSFNKPKGLIVNITNYTTEILLYNRRNILNTYVLPYGSVSLTEKFGNLSTKEAMDSAKQFVYDSIKDQEWIFNLDEEYEVIGTGEIFLSLSEISRRARKYPLQAEHNYSLTTQDVNKVYDVVSGMEVTKNSKIKGVSQEITQKLPAGLGIISAVISNCNKDVLAISKTGLVEGILLNNVLPLTLEKPISDNLGYSLQVLTEYYDKQPNNAEHVYNISMILFKQLKVLHKLNRSYVRVLRVASYMSACGLRVTDDSPEKISFNIILNSQIYGVSHQELVLAAFTSLMRNPDNFNLADWVKYKDLVTEADLDAVKKLAVILQIALSLDCTKFGSVVDISCDILGDSVIMKTITNGDVSLEIKQAKLSTIDFKRAYNKNLEIL
ncbi:MAG: hypothetical protein IKB42_04305 [Clostridia bacterium]|nr:hypothetical protein [Clostridia bacterium]